MLLAHRNGWEACYKNKAHIALMIQQDEFETNEAVRILVRFEDSEHNVALRVRA